MRLREDFLNKTKMVDAHNKKDGVIEVVDFLLNPEVIYKMIVASELELPVLTLIARDLEITFDSNSNFPVVVTSNNKNALARQNVGRIIKYIMDRYGYTPVYGGLSDRARIPAVSGAKYFSTSGVYKKTKEAILTIEIKSESI